MSHSKTDQELLTKWRARNPYITLATARELEKLEKRFAHLQARARS